MSPTRASSAACAVAGAACLAAAGAIAAIAPAPPALALADYAKREAKECGFCHVSPKGAGPRNAKGQEYEANGHRFGVQSWTDDANRAKYLRACSALLATWYAEADRLLAEVAKAEKLPGGLALVSATREKFAMFPRTWLRAAKTLLAKGERGVPNAMGFLARLESQFPGTDEGKEAARLLDEAVKGAEKDAARAKAADEARAVERVRSLVLRGRTEWDQGDAAAARKLFDEALADPRGKAWEREISDLVEGRSGG
jgi:hypothetical protein